MHIEHIAIWTNHLEQMKDFYVEYFQASAGRKYQNTVKQFESYFLSFSSGAQLELMSRPGISEIKGGAEVHPAGYSHMSFGCGSEESVDALTERMQKDGYQVVGGPHRTGDVYYESVVLDPDGNRLEITE
jgi:lactoylglutathione lyase